MTVAHWDDVPSRRLARGEMDAEWQALGDAAGCRGVGVNRVRVAPGKLPTPPHSHSVSEELYFVLAGSGLAWQDGQVHEVRPLDCVIHRPDELEHTFVAGPDGLELLVFGTRHPTEIGWLPRSRAIRIGRPWAEGRDDDPWDVEAAGPPLEVGEPAPRPENIVNVDEVELDRWEDRTVTAPLATMERSLRAGLHYETIAPGRRGVVPHCHSEEEEVFVVLEGGATLELLPSPRPLPWDAEPREIPLRPGHLVARPPGTRVSHSFRAGEDGVTMLVYGTREANDVVWYPRSRKIFWRGVGVMGRIETLEYFDGEPVEDD
ncbi:MAG TPA: cupin domain-containing protein [Gaiellaceae bacterium]|nr:cupin domain-containing protein [Gaiellaceae bacterium]